MSEWKHRILSEDRTAKTVVCATCGPSKGHKRTGRKTLVCSAAKKKSRAKYKYKFDWQNLKLTEKEKAAHLQATTCAICGHEFDSSRRKKCLDHDHETLMYRGTLCHQCNIGLGLLGDNQTAIAKALTYLQR